MTTPRDPATLLFTHMSIESEIRQLWKQISDVRANPDLPDAAKSAAVVRLLHVSNRLEVESMRQQEDYMQAFLASLKLEEIGARPMIEGRLKCHLTQQFSRRLKQRALSTGFVDSFSDKQGTIPSVAVLPRPPSGILLDRRKEIREELAKLARKAKLSEDDEIRRKALTAELRSITDV
jgi:hypothetical protein